MSTNYVFAFNVLLFISICFSVHFTTKQLNRHPPLPTHAQNFTFLDPVTYIFGENHTTSNKAFFYDLGGTNCACASEWSVMEYWGKVFSGQAFHLPHLSTPMQMQIILQKWEWTLLWMFANEVVEELQLGIMGKWGFTYDHFADLEPRYDSLLRDVVLCGVPSLILGSFFVHVTQISPFFKMPITCKWGNLQDKQSIQRLLLALVQMFSLERINLLYNISHGLHRFYLANFLLIPLNICMVWVIYFTNEAIQLQSAKEWWVHFHWSVIQVLIWFPAVYPFLDEIYLVYLSVALIWSYLSICNFYRERLLQPHEIELGDMQDMLNSDTQKNSFTFKQKLKHIFLCLVVPLCIGTFSCLQPFQYHGTIRYTRLGCGQFLGPNGEIGGYGCTYSQ